MKIFLVFLGVIAIIGLVWAIKPIMDNRARDHEQRLVAALNLVEESVDSSSTDILRVDLFSPEIARLSDDDRWRLSGILETQDRAGKAVFVRYVAAVAFSCTPYGKTNCGKIETLTLEDRPLVIDGAIVDELQNVLGTAIDPLGNSLPGAAAEPASLPALQFAPAPAPATEIPASEVPANEVPANEVPASESPTAAEPAVTATAPAENSEPIQGNRLIFLIQKSLRQLGYDPGPVDGQVGPRTTSAIQAYQQQADLPVNGNPSVALLEHITHAL